MQGDSGICKCAEGTKISYGLVNLGEELLSKGRVIFSFVDASGNDMGGYMFEKRKFWGWDCDYIGDCKPNNGCVEKCYSCDYYVFWIGVAHDVIKVEKVGC